MSLDMEELVAEKEKLEGDRKALVENLQKLKQQADQVQTQISAIGGAVQTCDYFISKLQQSSENSEPDGNEEDEDETT